MAGYTITRIQQIVDDLKTSWYFRVYSLAWLILALVVFSSMIILSRQSEKAHQENDIVMWVKNESQIQFPRFHLRLDHRSNEVFAYNPTCVFGSQVLDVAECQSFMGFQPPMNQCVAFNSDSFTALNDWTRGDNRIYCEAESQGVGPNGNQMMAFEFEGQNHFHAGGGAFQSTWFAPNDMTWILLGKNVLKESKNKDSITLWDTNLVYHSTNVAPNFYNVTVIMQNFYVRYFEPRDAYNGWMAVGNIGGVGFFMAVLHTLTMIIVGLVLANSSTFLSNGNDRHH